MSWLHIEGKFNGVMEKKTLQNGTNLAVFGVLEEAREGKEASVYPVTVFKDLAALVSDLQVGTPVAVKCKLDSRAYKDKHYLELKGFAVYTAKPAAMVAKPAEDKVIPF